MKNSKTWLIAAILLVGSFVANAHEKEPEEVKKIVEAQNFVFVAQRVSPVGRPTRDITGSDYDVTVTKAKIISYLPYFGKAYVAPTDPTQGGIQFTSSKFEYTKNKDNKGWSITIKPKDAPDVQQLYLTIFDNARATLQVVSTNRQNISFDGYIKEGKPEEKKAF
jgi:hypothetical protein